MNTDQLKGFIKADAGETQKDFGRLFGNAEQEAKGLALEVEGKEQKRYGDVMDALETEDNEARYEAEDARSEARYEAGYEAENEAENARNEDR